MKRLGVISGKGTLPCLLAREAKKRGYFVLMVALDPIADCIDRCADEVKKVNVGKLGKLIKTLKEANITEAVMAGKVSKNLIYQSNITPDRRALKLLFSIKDRKDDTILQAISDELESEGIRLMKTTDFATDLLMPSVVLTKRGPTKEEKRDIEFGFDLAKKIGWLDIGQTIVVKNQAVMAVEAIEGTDEAILRGGTLAREGAVIVKVAKPQQDMRYDVPVVGLDTLRSMIKVHAKALAVEAEKSIIMQRDEMVNEANRMGITIVGIP